MKIYHVQGTRSVRVIWLCEELELSYEIESIDFSPTFRQSPEWRAKSPTGKVPAMDDQDFTMFESGAMLQYVLDRYGEGRLMPTPGSNASALYLQWCWFAEATFARPLGDIAHHTVMKPEAERIPAVVEDARARALSCLDAVNETVSTTEFLIGDTFTAADIMMGYTLMLADRFNVLENDHPSARSYFERLTSRAGY
ncbi:MAG: glutathione S-transferase family protein, partial [Pseudomonadota bacterium]|nr:glutathione S-transferase family protein [Pseudomonadota bacterium]